MTPARQLFHQDKELRNWWAQVVDDPRFAKVMLYAGIAHLQSKPASLEHIAGANDFEDVLKLLPSADEVGEDLLGQASPGLHHDLDKPEPEPEPKPK